MNCSEYKTLQAKEDQQKKEQKIASNPKNSIGVTKMLHRNFNRSRTAYDMTHIITVKKT